MRAKESPDGRARSADCPRAGVVKLWLEGGHYAEIPYTCKTWRCKGCRDRIKRLFTARVLAGLTTLEGCSFITVTYRTASVRYESAGYVARDWKALWRKLRGTPFRSLEWLRVMELTKKGMPHHHLVMGWPKGTTPSMEARCWPDGSDIVLREYKRRFADCECMAHSLARPWKEVTGDTFIVDAERVWSPPKAAAYLAKYMFKEFDRARAEALGMARRWSTSRGWPGRGKMRLKNTEWNLVMAVPGMRIDKEVATAAWVLEREGPEALAAVFDKWNEKADVKRLIRRFEDATIIG